MYFQCIGVRLYDEVVRIAFFKTFNVAFIFQKLLFNNLVFQKTGLLNIVKLYFS